MGLCRRWIVFYYHEYTTRVCNLGEIINDEVHLSDFGQIVNDEWYKSFEIRDELFLAIFIIMPNHIHAIVGISKMNNDNVKNHPGKHFTDCQNPCHRLLPDLNRRLIPQSMIILTSNN